MSGSTIARKSMPINTLAGSSPARHWVVALMQWWWAGWVENWRPMVRAEAAIRAAVNGER
jgi:hypothetical protein